MSAYIKQAAIRLSSDLFVGPNHGVCLRKLKSASQQGFVNQNGRFYTREEALDVAIDAGQVINKHHGKPNELLAEDLREDNRFTPS